MVEEEVTTIRGEVRQRRHRSVVGTCSEMFSEDQKSGLSGKSMEGNDDMDIGNKLMLKEYLTKVEMTTSHECEAVQELVVVMPVNSEEVKRDPCKPKAHRVLRIKQPKPSIKTMALIVVMLAVPANGIDFQTPHLVAEKCKSWLNTHWNECPDKIGDETLWNEMNDICCGTLSKEKIHCQMDYDKSGAMFTIAQCLPEKEIRESVIGQLYLNGSGIDTSTVCYPGTYRSQSVNSTFVTYRYCTETKTKENDMQEKLCDGGPGADDRFVCRVGFVNHCTGSTCYCRNLPCPKGQQAFRTPTIPYPLQDCFELEGTITNLDFEYGCEQEVQAPFTASPSSNGDTRSSFTTATTSTKDENDGKDSDDDINDDDDDVTGVVIGVVIGVILVILLPIGVIVVMVWLKKRHTGSYTAADKLSESDDSNDSSMMHIDVED